MYTRENDENDFVFQAFVRTNPRAATNPTTKRVHNFVFSMKCSAAVDLFSRHVTITVYKSNMPPHCNRTPITRSFLRVREFMEFYFMINAFMIIYTHTHTKFNNHSLAHEQERA